MHLWEGWGMCVIFREQDDQHLDEEQGNAVDLEGERQLS